MRQCPWILQAPTMPAAIGTKNNIGTRVERREKAIGLVDPLVGSKNLGVPSLHHGERTAVTRGRQGLLGTARDGSGRLGTARDRSGRLGTARDARDEARETEITYEKSLIRCNLISNSLAPLGTARDGPGWSGNGRNGHLTSVTVRCHLQRSIAVLLGVRSP